MLTSNGYVLDESADRLGELEPVPTDEMADRDRLWQRLDRLGYLYLRGVIDSPVVEAFRAYYFRTLASSGLLRAGSDPALGLVGDAEVDRESFRRLLFREVVPGPEYHRFCTQPAIRDWYAWFLGGEPFLHRRRIIRHTRPGETGIGSATQAHYDLLYIRGGSDRVLSSWIPLGDCPVSRGGLAYLEGSHRRVAYRENVEGVRPPAASLTADLPGLADLFDARWLLADYKSGDMVIHTAYTVHAALDNADPDGVMRLSTDIRYQLPDQPIDGRWQCDWHDKDGL